VLGGRHSEVYMEKLERFRKARRVCLAA